jgi:hypothetical protein
MNRRQFIQRLTAAATAAALPGALAPVAAPARHLLDGVIAWCSGLRESVHRWTEGATEVAYYSYDTDLRYLICDGPATVQRIWADGVCVYGPGADPPVDVTVTHERDATWAHFRELPLEPFGNRVPHMKVEVEDAT